MASPEEDKAAKRVTAHSSSITSLVSWMQLKGLDETVKSLSNDKELRRRDRQIQTIASGWSRQSQDFECLGIEKDELEEPGGWNRQETADPFGDTATLKTPAVWARQDDKFEQFGATNETIEGPTTWLRQV
eukprot:TRINITY_DN17387_c0_g1_i2.p2 TRINITY_DN17387_c0_g1~~TRINITY_DN17387_c0_g1_i2.p2  ORF type:complete len:131 (-),score=36.50 TRINITY_DN17387_c0_g1_i2:402-794(-)